MIDIRDYKLKKALKGEYACSKCVFFTARCGNIVGTQGCLTREGGYWVEKDKDLKVKQDDTEW